MSLFTYNTQGIQEFADAIITHLEDLDKSHKVIGQIGLYQIHIIELNCLRIF